MSDTKRGRRGEGSIYKTKIKDKEYWIAKYTPPEKAKPIKKYGRTETDAKRLLKQIKFDAIKNNPVEVQKLSVQQYMTDWMENIEAHRLKPKSYDTKESTLENNVFPYIGDYQIAGLTSKEVQAMISSLIKENLSYSTIKKAYHAVNACFKRGVENGEINKNPCVGVSLPETKKKKASKIRFLNDDEIEKVCSVCVFQYNNGAYMYRLGYAVIFLIYTGLRIGEFLALKWSDIDTNNQTVTIRNNAVRVKNREDDGEAKYKLLIQDSVKSDAGDRIVPLPQKALKAVQEMQKLNGYFEYIACTAKGKIIHEKAFDRMLRAICVRSGVEPCGAHVLRHTFASLLFRKGTDVKIVSKILGHSDISITYNTYIHLIQEQEIQAISLLDL